MKQVPYHTLHKLSFDVYRAEEIKKLSVLEISNPNSFDDLEHPTTGGLYDPRLGPNDQQEQCETCGLQAIFCPGHSGNIILPLPVFNPVFIRTLYQLLQGSCFKCYRLMAPTSAIHLAIHQFHVLDYGLVDVVHELQEAIVDLSLVSSDAGGKIESVYEDKFKNIVERATENLDLHEYKDASQVKSVVECRNRVMKDFIKTHLMNAKRKCCYCKERNSKIALKNNTTFLQVQMGKAIKVKKEKLENGEEASPDDPYGMGNSEVSPSEVKRILELVWQKDHVLLERLFGILKSPPGLGGSPIDIFFTEILLVPPSRFRPISVVKGRKFLNPQSTAFKDVLTQSYLLKIVHKTVQGSPLTFIEKDLVNKVRGKTDSEKLNLMWRELQKAVNCVYDSDLDKLKKEKTSFGVKQILEKKEGLFRKHMMGKRVNYAARSVISPDPYIMVDEIGVPTVFATKLTYPTPVTPWNVQKLTRAVLNGPNVHPGAEKVEMEDGKVVKLSATDEIHRYAVACQLLTPPPSLSDAVKGVPKIVHRHLQNGDILLLNRQPTLHKPSIMAHRARVLKGEKTLRLHYANCKSYNADFDGDEMNAHYPQSELARSEGYNIASVNQQYLVPKDGTPLSGLIQDHIIAATLLTMRGQFFSREDYQQLVYGAVSFLNKKVKMLHPAMIKPEVLWSGKQVFSTVVINVVPDGKVPPTIEGKTKISGKNWQRDHPRPWRAGGTEFHHPNSPLHRGFMSEDEVIIRKGELLSGVIDKANIGPTPYGLVHCCYEIYGGQTSSALLTALARLFTHYLQFHSGFTLGIEDILLTPRAEKKRKKIMKKGKKVGPSVVAAAFDLDDENEENLINNYRNAHISQNDIGLKSLDFEMKKKTDDFNNGINSACMPLGLYKRFPQNNLQLMIQSGAKGSTVNALQMSCLLGQIELEGRRVPLMLNGSTLPSFLPYDSSPRAGGFIDGRFLTGIRPQEFFFHCMAGREGLVDTAVKTSRSGYLQRCLIKHLEGIVVNYDFTVRDSDGSVIQFLYGEDGLDVGKVQLLKEHRIDILSKNIDAIMRDVVKEGILDKIEDPLVSEELFGNKRKIARFKQKHRYEKKNMRSSAFLNFAKSYKLEEFKKSDWFSLSEEAKRSFDKRSRYCPDPVNTRYPPYLTLGCVSEHLDTIIHEYLSASHDGMLESEFIKNGTAKELHVADFEKMVYYRALKSLAQPGEAVGLLAAQSVGEPSTQMTLNTFHFAGRGEMNVTLGIPRLREILMVASANIATPTMDLPIFIGSDVEKKAEKLKVKLSRVYLKELLEVVDIKEVLHIEERDRFRCYTIRIQFLPYKCYKGILHATPSDAIKYVERTFLIKLIAAVKKKLSQIALSGLLSSVRKTEATPQSDEENELLGKTFTESADHGASSDEEDIDGDTTSSKFKARHDQDREYEEPEPEEDPDEPDEMEEDTEGLQIKVEPEEDETQPRIKLEPEDEAQPQIKVEVKTEIQPQMKVKPKTKVQPQNKDQAERNVLPRVKTEARSQIKVEPGTDRIKLKPKKHPEIKVEPEDIAQPQIKVEPETEMQPKTKSKTKVKSQINVQTEREGQPRIKVEREEQSQPEIKVEPGCEVQPQIKVEPADKVQSRIKVEPKDKVKKHRKNESENELQVQFPIKKKIREVIIDEEPSQSMQTAFNPEVKQENEDTKCKRIEEVLRKCPMISRYDFDENEGLWCEFTIQLLLENTKVDMRTIFEEEASNAILYRVPSINKAFLVKNPNSFIDCKMIKTEGVNFLEIFGVEYSDTIDTSKVYSNDIHAIAKIFGIEAAVRVIVKEIKNVFAIYGIEVDPRHLLLIADYMTFDGTYRPFNRIGMGSNASPLQQMTFETTMSFLQNALLTGSEDHLKSPSARLVVGQSVKGGTGSFDLFLRPPSELQR